VAAMNAFRGSIVRPTESPSGPHVCQARIPLSQTQTARSFPQSAIEFPFAALHLDGSDACRWRVVQYAISEFVDGETLRKTLSASTFGEPGEHSCIGRSFIARI